MGSESAGLRNLLSSYKTYYIFGSRTSESERVVMNAATSSQLLTALPVFLVNAMAFVHMFLTAYETKGYTLEEMDDVFERGMRAWKTTTNNSRLDELEAQFSAGTAKFRSPMDRELPRRRDRGSSGSRNWKRRSDATSF